MAIHENYLLLNGKSLKYKEDGKREEKNLSSKVVFIFIELEISGVSSWRDDNFCNFGYCFRELWWLSFCLTQI